MAGLGALLRSGIVQGYVFAIKTPAVSDAEGSTMVVSAEVIWTVGCCNFQAI